MSFLSYKDMEMASLTCQEFRAMIYNSSHFVKKTTLRLTNRKKMEVSKGNKLENLQLTSLSFGVIELDTRLSPEVLKFLQNHKEILGGIQTLRLIRGRVVAIRMLRMELLKITLS